MVPGTDPLVIPQCRYHWVTVLGFLPTGVLLLLLPLFFACPAFFGGALFLKLLRHRLQREGLAHIRSNRLILEGAYQHRLQSNCKDLVAIANPY